MHLGVNKTCRRKGKKSTLQVSYDKKYTDRAYYYNQSYKTFKNFKRYNVTKALS